MLIETVYSLAVICRKSHDRFKSLGGGNFCKKRLAVMGHSRFHEAFPVSASQKKIPAIIAGMSKE